MNQKSSQTLENNDSLFDNGISFLSSEFWTYVSLKLTNPTGAPTQETVEEMQKDGWKIELEVLEGSPLVSDPYSGLSATSSAQSAYAKVFNPQGESVRHSNPEYINAVIATEKKLENV